MGKRENIDLFQLSGNPTDLFHQNPTSNPPKNYPRASSVKVSSRNENFTKNLQSTKSVGLNPYKNLQNIKVGNKQSGMREISPDFYRREHPTEKDENQMYVLSVSLIFRGSVKNRNIDGIKFTRTKTIKSCERPKITFKNRSNSRISRREERKPAYKVYKNRLQKSVDLRLSGGSIFDHGVIQLRSITSKGLKSDLNPTSTRDTKSSQNLTRSQKCPRSMDKPAIKAIKVDPKPMYRKIYPVKIVKITNKKDPFRTFYKQKSCILTESTKSDVFNTRSIQL